MFAQYYLYLSNIIYIVRAILFIFIFENFTQYYLCSLFLVLCRNNGLKYCGQLTARFFDGGGVGQVDPNPDEKENC